MEDLLGCCLDCRHSFSDDDKRIRHLGPEQPRKRNDAGYDGVLRILKTFYFSGFEVMGDNENDEKSISDDDDDDHDDHHYSEIEIEIRPKQAKDAEEMGYIDENDRDDENTIEA